jgi:hypothetical protein
VGNNLREFDDVRQGFIKIFEEEEADMALKQMPVLTSIIYKSWEFDRV